jgi:hypothetical protein
VVLDRVDERSDREPSDPACRHRDDSVVRVPDPDAVPSPLEALRDVEDDKVAERRLQDWSRLLQLSPLVCRLTEPTVLRLHGKVPLALAH